MVLLIILYLNGWFLQVPQIGGGLSRLLTKCLHPRVSQPESINNHLTYKWRGEGEGGGGGRGGRNGGYK